MSVDEVFREELRKLISGEILFDEPADRHTSIGVGGRIDALAFPESEEEIARLVAFLRSNRIPFLPVGNWTNLIVRDGGYRGVLIA
ncbi:MAG: FAD-binding protein, partial [Proteobacteria bacterium]|nr:FAD-binding protein [Pseudomonadota bacterium]